MTYQFLFALVLVLYSLFQFQLLSARCPHTSPTLFCSRIVFLGFEASGMNSQSFYLQMPSVLFKFPRGFLSSKIQSSRCLHSSFSRALSANYCLLGRQNQNGDFKVYPSWQQERLPVLKTQFPVSHAMILCQSTHPVESNGSDIALQLFHTLYHVSSIATL